MHQQHPLFGGSILTAIVGLSIGVAVGINVACGPATPEAVDRTAALARAVPSLPELAPEVVSAMAPVFRIDAFTSRSREAS